MREVVALKMVFFRDPVVYLLCMYKWGVFLVYVILVRNSPTVGKRGVLFVCRYWRL